jgi:mRNA interferase RelE/StbE
MPGSYAIAWASSAQRDLARLPEKIATALVEFAYESLAADPRRVGRALHLDLAGHHSARRGDFRVIYRIDDEQHTVHITALDHRADGYRPRRRRRPS